MDKAPSLKFNFVLIKQINTPVILNIKAKNKTKITINPCENANLISTSAPTKQNKIISAKIHILL